MQQERSSSVYRFIETHLDDIQMGLYFLTFSFGAITIVKFLTGSPDGSSITVMGGASAGTQVLNMALEKQFGPKKPS